MAEFRLTRRNFLIGTSATLLLSSLYSGYRQLGTYPSHSLNVQNLSDKEVFLYQILGNWLIPPNQGLSGSGGDDQSILAIDQLFEFVPEGKRFLLSALPLAFEHGTALHEFGAISLSQMPPEKQSEYLNAWGDSANLIKTQLFAALKTIFGFSYFEREEVLKEMNISPFCQVLS